jgi:outer membrane lipoprotein-sorting protein
MYYRVITRLIGLLILFFILTPCFALTGEEILRKVDANIKYNTIEYVGKMEIFLGDEKPRLKIMKVTAVGSKKAYVEFLNKEDINTKYLKLDKKMWIHDGEEANTFLISGHMLKQGMMGSDISYEDALESDSLYEKYNITIAGEEKIGDRGCYVINLEAKVKEVSYEKRKMWIDKERFIQLKEEKYAKSGKFLKESKVLDVGRIGERYFPVKSEIVDKLRENSRTVFTMSELKFDVPVSEKVFSLRYLER